MAISALQVKELREKTGVGMMDCKKALLEMEGDLEKAVTYLREKGLSKAAKKSDRIANEGQIVIVRSDDRSTGVMMEVTCETDFVARNERFRAFGQGIAQVVLDSKISSQEELASLSVEGQPLDTYVGQFVMELGENVSVGRFVRLTGAEVGHYVHSNGKIGSIIAFSNPVDDEIARGIAMHLAATNALSISSGNLPQDMVENERNIIRQQVLNEGKPAAIVDRIVEGKLNKYFKEVCLLEQSYVIDPDKTVKDVLSGKGDIVDIARFAIGS